MATTIEPRQAQPPQGVRDALLATETFTTTGATAPVRLTGDIVCQVSGTATNIVGIFERNPQDPALFPTGWAPADDFSYSGSLVAGISARRYFDPLTAFYRFRITTLTGGNALVAFSGEGV